MAGSDRASTCRSGGIFLAEHWGRLSSSSPFHMANPLILVLALYSLSEHFLWCACSSLWLGSIYCFHSPSVVW